MYELIQITDKCYYIESPAKIGLVKTGESEVCLIDSGNDKDAGKKVLKILNANGWSLKAIYNTHSHADHIGGNAYLQAQTGCKIYARGIERDFTVHPVLEPYALFGATPPEELQGKFLLAKPSDAQLLSESDLPNGWELIELGGHSADMVGFVIDGEVAYIGDSVSSEQTLNKYAVGYTYDIDEMLLSLDKLQALQVKAFVPSHAPVTCDISDLARLNRDKTYEITALIESLCVGATTETVLKGVFDHYNLTLNFQQSALVGSALKAYLSKLLKDGKIYASFEDNLLKWNKRR